MSRPATLFDKIWRAHAVAEHKGRTLLYIDRVFTEDASGVLAYEAIDASGRSVRNPGQIIAVADHFVPTRAWDGIFADAGKRRMVESVSEFTARHGITYFGLGHPAQGISHVVGPELGLSLPGMTIVCGDSHTATHGGLGCLAFGIGSTELAQVLTDQVNWQTKPKRMRIIVDGKLGFGLYAKDVILHAIMRLGTAAGVGHAIEYAGSAISAMPVEGRMTIANMSIEVGAKYGLVAPDDVTFEYLASRPQRLPASLFDRALAEWRDLRTDEGVAFDHEEHFDAAAIEPMLTWGVTLDHMLPVGGEVPDPDREATEASRSAMRRALDYMDLRPGTKLTDIKIDRVFIGTCTNARLSDLRAAAAVLKGRRAKVPGMVVPGSSRVRQDAEAEGLDRIFIEAGLEWRMSGCSMCTAENGDVVAPGERCASTQNRNFVSRQGPGARTHIMSPAMVAAAALEGCITDVRRIGRS